MDLNEKATRLVEQAENAGLHVEYDRGLLKIKTQVAGDWEDDVIGFVDDLGASLLPCVRSLLRRRAASAAARQHLGQRVWSPDFGWGTVVGADGDTGLLIIEIKNSKSRRPSKLSIAADDLVFVVIEEAGGAASPANNDAKPEKPRRGIFEVFRGSPSGSKNASAGREV